MPRRRKIVLRPFCYYCNRIFQDESILLNHQRARHFKCLVCKKKTQNAPGLKTHYMKVHHEQLTRIPHSVKSRGSNPDIRIVGMEGIPSDIKHPLDDGSKRIRRRLGGFDPSTMQLPSTINQFMATPTTSLPTGSNVPMPMMPTLSTPMQTSTMAKKVAATVPTFVEIPGSKNCFLTYGDNDLSMEERRSQLARYKVHS
ncbi:hypothetical protein P9112_000782 [Eukaryota sp. TZLM1-RC]